MGWTSIIAAAVMTVTAAPSPKDEAEIHTFHCLHGCPMGASSTNDLVVREIYTLSSNDRTKFADWVAYRVTRETVGPSEGRRWQVDPWLGVDETLRPNDYDGAPDALDIDRGHQAPLAAFSGTPFADDTNILSNITPQSSALNQAPWQYLEAQERGLVTRSAEQGAVPVVYVLTGPLFERPMPEMPMPEGRRRHRVPSGYWKVLATPDGRMTAFIFDQATPRAANYCDFRVSLEAVEIRADLTLFPRLASRELLRSVEYAVMLTVVDDRFRRYPLDRSEAIAADSFRSFGHASIPANSSVEFNLADGRVYKSGPVSCTR